MEKQHENKAQKVERFIPLGLQERASLVAQIVKSPSAMKETQVQSLGREDPLEKGMATTLVFLPGEFHGQRILVGYSLWDRKESDTTD